MFKILEPTGFVDENRPTVMNRSSGYRPLYCFISLYLRSDIGASNRFYIQSNIFYPYQEKIQCTHVKP